MKLKIEAREWFESECLEASQLFLHSNEGGDILGNCIEVIKYEIL